MAKFFLINTVLLGTTKLVAGSSIDDTQYDTTKITDAGGVLWPDDSGGAAVVSGAAAKAQAAQLRGASEIACESLMQSAVQTVQSTEDAAHDSALVKKVQIVITQALIAAKGNVASGTFDAVVAFPANARLLGLEVNVGTKVQNVGATDVTTVDVGTDGAGKSAIAGATLATAAGLVGGDKGIGFAVGGEKLRVTMNSTVNLSTITAGALTVTATYAVPG